MEDLTLLIGKTVIKKSRKPFKSGRKLGVPVSVTTNFSSNKPAYLMMDGSIVDCYQVELYETKIKAVAKRDCVVNACVTLNDTGINFRQYKRGDVIDCKIIDYKMKANDLNMVIFKDDLMYIHTTAEDFEYYS